MALDLRTLSSVVRVASAGTLLGSGSVVSVPTETEGAWSWPYVVTAHHVIENQVAVEIVVPDPLRYGHLMPALPVDGWRQPLPGVDLAVAPLPIERLPRFQATPLDDFVPEGMMPPLGGEILYLGVFAPLEVPMVRAGTLGAVGVHIAKPSYSYAAHLIDCRSYGGFSGSPCLSTMHYAILNDDPQDPMPDDEMPTRADGSKLQLGRIGVVNRFAGIFTAHYSDESTAEGVVSRYGVGVMLPCDYVREALMTDDAKQERQEWDVSRGKTRASELPPLEDAAAEPSEFRRFEDLAKQLVNTPKPKG
jgi:trypsin-like peptidase